MTDQKQSPASENGEAKGRLIVAFPMYRQVSVPWFFNWLKMKKDPIVGTVATEGIYVPMAMRSLVSMAFDMFGDEWDRLVVFEHDMIPGEEAFNRIAQYRPEHDIVGSVYFKHDWPHHVMAWMQMAPPQFSPLTAEVVATMYDYPALYEVDGVALGFTSIARRVFEEWNPDVPMWDPIPPLVGHDLHFCNEAKKPQHGPNRDQAFKVWLDSGIGCGHLTLLPIGYSHSQEALAQDDTLETWEQSMQRSGVDDPRLLMAMHPMRDL